MVETLSPTEPGMSALERQSRTIYRWLLVSPLITVPCMLLGLALAEMAQQEQQERAAQAARQSVARGIRGTEPSWSPDGARLAFVSERARGGNPLGLAREEASTCVNADRAPGTDARSSLA